MHLAALVLLLATLVPALAYPPLPQSFSEKQNQILQQELQRVPASCSCSVEDSLPLYPSCIGEQTGTTNCVPRIIHQTWATKDIPSTFRSAQESWRRSHPQWLLLLWSDDDIEQWISLNFPSISQLFRRLSHNVQRADIFRYLVLSSYGGVYADLDLECLQPLDTYISHIRRPLAFLAPGWWWSSISNSLMISRFCPDHWAPIIRFCLTAIEQMQDSVWSVLPHARVMSSTGPTMLRQYLEKDEPRAICHLPRALFNPCDYCTRNCTPDPSALTWHHYARTWNSWDTEVLNAVQCNPVTCGLLLLLALVVSAAACCLRRPRKVRRHTV